jgi:WD40 repeat protein
MMVTSLAVLPDGQLASGSADATVIVWDSATGERVLALAGHTGAVRELAVLPGGRLASSSTDCTMRVWK